MTTSKESATCLELALEGERLCKSGDFAGGIAFFEAALKVGTQDMRTLSAVYSQLGNAYFYVNDYEKALNFHQLDLAIARSMRDRVGEGKASGNLGNTLKMLARYDEAIDACMTHLQIARSLNDKIGEGRALYNLGNVYHTKGKQLARSGQRDPGDFPEDVRQCLLKGAEYYEQNLRLMTQMGDKSAMGRALGNLGNTHYLLGHFKEAVIYHSERLKIAQEFGDRAAERRAQCNLGNARVFLGDFEEAVDNYQETLRLAQELNDRIMEAQACYSLGNCFTLMRDFERALEYHRRHLSIALDLKDSVGEARAYWSIANALTALGRHDEALTYAAKHLEVSKDLQDDVGQDTAAQTVRELKRIIEEKNSGTTNPEGAVGGATPKTFTKRLSMDNMQLLKLTPGLTPTPNDEAASSNFHLNLLSNESETSKTKKDTAKQTIIPSSKPADDTNFLDLLAQFQCKRMDDQRCSFDPRFDNKENHPSKISTTQQAPKPRKSGRIGQLSRSISSPVYAMAPPAPTSSNHSSSDQNQDPPASSSREAYRDDLFDLIARCSRRMEDQRASLPPVRQATNGPGSLPLAHSSDSARDSNYNRVRSDPNPRPVAVAVPTEANAPNPRRAALGQSRQLSLGHSKPPDEDFFDMLVKCQSSRLEDQRSSLPSDDGGKDGDPGNGDHMLKRTSQCAHPTSGGNTPPTGVSGATVPDDDFFSLIMRVQSGRIDDQRSQLPSDKSTSSMTSVDSAGNESKKGSKKGSRKK